MMGSPPWMDADDFAHGTVCRAREPGRGGVGRASGPSRVGQAGTSGARGARRSGKLTRGDQRGRRGGWKMAVARRAGRAGDVLGGPARRLGRGDRGGLDRQAPGFRAGRDRGARRDRRGRLARALGPVARLRPRGRHRRGVAPVGASARNASEGDRRPVAGMSAIRPGRRRARARPIARSVSNAPAPAQVFALGGFARMDRRRRGGVRFGCVNCTWDSTPRRRPTQGVRFPSDLLLPEMGDPSRAHETGRPGPP